MTFKNADPLREALRVAPQDRVLVETDAPYLTPMPYRGRPNASYLVPLTVRATAQVRGEDLASCGGGHRRGDRRGLRGPWQAWCRRGRRRRFVATRAAGETGHVETESRRSSWPEPGRPLSFRDRWPGSGRSAGAPEASGPLRDPRSHSTLG
ncbi:MAG: TatD family hydrolase [Nocardioides sp.]